jgi:quinol monooxygenase YgiN
LYGGLVKFVCKAGKRDEFLELLRWDTRVARESEPGTLRLDAWEAEGEPGAIYLYEVYTDPAAFEVHTSNEPVRRFYAIRDSLIESTTMVIPFGESVTSNADE